MNTKIIALFLSIMCYGAFAQVQSNTLKVGSRVTYIDPDPTYKAEIMLSNAFSSDINNTMELDELKANFKKALEKNALSWSDVKEHSGTFGFEAMRYNKEGIIYEYQTKSVQKIKRLLKIKSPFLELSSVVSSMEIDDKKAQKIIKMAFDLALKKATLMAKIIHKKLDTIVAVEENSFLLSRKSHETTIFYGSKPGVFYYDIMVTYKLK